MPVSALLLATAILLTGSGLQGVLLPVRAELEGFSTLWIALIGSSFYLGFALGCARGPRLVERVGHIRSFTAMTASAAAAPLLLAFFVEPLVWCGLRIASGFCFAVLYMVIESWLNERSDRSTRGFVLSAYMVINLTVITLGQLMLPLQDPRGMGSFAIVSIFVSLAAVPVALTGAVAPAPLAAARVRPGRLYRTSPAGVAACAVAGLSNGAIWSLGPQFARSRELDEQGIALFMGAAVLGGAIGQWPLGRLSDLGDRRWVMLLAAAGALTAAGLLVAEPFEGRTALLLLSGAWGAFAFPLYSLGVAHANDHAAPAEFVETSGGLLLVYGAAAVLGPMLASAVEGASGMAGLFASSAGVHAVLAGFLLWRKSRSPAPPETEHIRFTEALQASRTVSSVFDAEIQSELEASAQGEEAEQGRGGSE